MITTAVIMAAGLGTRFGHYTESIPKGFVEILGESMIVRSIKTLLYCGIKRIIIGTGYKKEAYEALREEFPMLETCFSPRYAETNSMYTLYNMRELIGHDDFILLESDLIFDSCAIKSLLQCRHKDALLVASITKFQDQYYVEANDEGILTNCSTNKEEVNVKGEFVGIHKLSNGFFTKMCAHYSDIVKEEPRLGYEYELLYMSNNVSPLYVHVAENIKWYEIDDEADLRYAEENIAPYCRIDLLHDEY